MLLLCLGTASSQNSVEFSLPTECKITCSFFLRKRKCICLASILSLVMSQFSIFFLCAESILKLLQYFQEQLPIKKLFTPNLSCSHACQKNEKNRYLSSEDTLFSCSVFKFHTKIWINVFDYNFILQKYSHIKVLLQDFYYFESLVG